MTLARSIALGLWLISADAAAQLLPPALPWLSPRSPALWLGLDAGVEPAASADAAVDNPQAVIAAALTAWLQALSTSARSWPADGVRIGVLAVLPDDTGHLQPLVVHPPEPLDVTRHWPEQPDRRHFRLAGSYQLLDASGQVLSWGADWQPGQRLQFEMPWLLPADVLPASDGVAGIRLQLPARLPSEHRPRLLLDNMTAPGVSATFSAELILRADTGSALVADMTAWWQQWRLQQGQGALPARWWRLHLVTDGDTLPAGGWREPGSGMMATLDLSWRWPAGMGTARARLLRLLPTLLPDAALQAPADASAMLAALQRLHHGQPVATLAADWATAVAVPAGCGHTGTLLLQAAMPDPAATDLQAAARQPSQLPDLPVHGLVLSAQPQLWPGLLAWQQAAAGQWPELLTRWVDRHLAPGSPGLVADVQPLSPGRSALLLTTASQVPGRSRLQAAQGWLACAELAPCSWPAPWPDPLPGSAAVAAASSASPRWLADDGVASGALLPPMTPAAWPAAELDTLLTALALPVTPSMQAALRHALQVVTTQPPPWLGTDLLLPAAVPSAAATPSGHRLRMGQDGLVRLLRPSGEPAWLWLPAALRSHWARLQQDAAQAGEFPLPARWQVMTRPRPDGRADTHAFNVHGGVMLALHWQDPEQPRLAWRHVPDALGPVRHLSLFTTVSADGPMPWLLAAHDSGAVSLRDGLDGRLQWSAMAEPTLAPWQVLMHDALGFLAYAPARSGSVWRLQGRPAEPGGLHLQVAARLAPAAAATADWLDQARLSLAWQRVGVQRLPRLALVASRLDLSSEAGVGEGIWAWHDHSWPQGDAVRAESLSHWSPEQLLAPVTAIGWHRPWAMAGTRVVSAPGWLQGALVVTTASPRQGSSECAPPVWQQQAHHLPWLMTGVTGEAGMARVQTLAEPVAETATAFAHLAPQLAADGSLSWQGPAADYRISLPVPAAWRQRISRQPLPLRP